MVQGYRIEATTYQSRIIHFEKPLLYMERDQTFAEPFQGIDAYSFWLLAFADLRKGQIAVRARDGFITFEGPTALFIPPRSPVEWRIQPGGLTWRALASSSDPVGPLPSTPVSFRWSGEIPNSMAAVHDLLSNLSGSASFLHERPASATAAKAKRAIDQRYASPLWIGEIAAELGLSWPAMTRDFKRAYGLSPISYRNRLRVTYAMMRMSAGDSVTDAFLSAGFSSPSRFLDQFKKFFGALPSAYCARRNLAQTAPPPGASEILAAERGCGLGPEFGS